MKIVVIGGTGLIGSKIIVLLRSAGHHALAAAPETGVNAVTGEGLATVLRDAAVIVDLANSRSFEPSAAMDFFAAHEKNSTSPTDVLSRGPSLVVETANATIFVPMKWTTTGGIIRSSLR
jgi:uncharacterized protein YbjT (DUF2867 family)